ncbi:MAG: hypothetical protein HYS13_07520 [Planctomycetia bacterium]|nr:hypothetical protein [Planctomycetia bacterium]
MIIVIKRDLFAHLRFDATREGLFSLELVAVVVLLGAFLLGEVFKGVDWMRGRRPHPGISMRDMLCIFLTVVASLLIYALFARIMDLPSVGELPPSGQIPRH